MAETKKFSGYSVAVCLAIVVLITQGALGTFGVFLPYIIQSEGWSVTAVSLMATCCSTVVFFMNTLMYKAINKFGAKNTLLLGIFCCGLHYFIYGSSKSIIQLYIGACIGGVAMGFATNAMLSFILTRWFVEKRSKVISWAMIGIGFGGTIFAFISGQAIEILGDWRKAYYIVGALIWIFAFPIAIFGVKDSPAKLGQLPLGGTENVVDQGPKAKVKLTQLPEFRTVAFWLLWIGMFLAGFVSPGFSQHLTSIFREGGVEAASATNYLSLGKLFTAVGFIILGFISENEKTGTKTAVSFIVATLVVLCISTYIIDGVPTRGLLVYVWIAVVSYGLAQTAQHIISTYTTMEAYGPERYPVLYGVFQGSAMFAGAFGSLVLGAFKDAFGNYQLGCIVYGIIAVLALVFIFSALSMLKKKAAN